MNPDNWNERHKNFSAALDADQVECRAMLEGMASVEAGMEDERISGMVDDQLVDAGNSWAERQAVLESLSSSISEELTRRMELMKSAYPFEVSGGSLSYNPSKTGVYEFCLSAARNPRGAATGKPHASTVFEWIARDILVLHLGKGAKGFRTGWPPHETKGRGSRTKETFELLSEQCGEFCWSPIQHHPSDPPPQLLKDVGLDVVVWKPWPDGRLAQLFALGQCACGKNDIDPSKARELSTKRLEGWLRPVCYTKPQRCFLVAHHIPNNGDLYDLAEEGGLIFDRARLAMLAESDPDAVKSVEDFDYHALAKFYATQQVD